MQIEINGEQYELIDTLECITLADSFVKNKIGFGHGEAKLYVGNENNRLISFLKEINKSKCFFRKSDFREYLHSAKAEFMEPQQDYVKKAEMTEIYDCLDFAINQFPCERLLFDSYRVEVAPPRVYINSKSNYYDFVRSLVLPNISYLSIMKLRDTEEKIFYYFKVFFNNESDVCSHIYKEELEQIALINQSSKLSDKHKISLIEASTGQGEYRKKIVAECRICPFTNVSDERLLVATHIKPWALSNEQEKIDPKNGFLFTPTFEFLFEKGFISFDDDKILMVSPWLSPANQENLNIYNGKYIERLPLDSKRRVYLGFHREYIFKY